jgi:PhoH-like ATPase
MIKPSNLNLLKTSRGRTIYLLDTNVMLHDPSSIFRFHEHIVLISLLTIEEIDAKKKDSGIGYNARDISNKLELLIERREENADGGISIPNGNNGTMFFVSGMLSKNFPAELSLSYKDNLLLSQAMGLQENFPKHDFIMVSKDRNLRIKCRALGLNAQDYLHDKISEEYLSSFFRPIKHIALDEDEINKTFKTNSETRWTVNYKKKWQLNENEGVAMFDPSGHLFGLGIRKKDKLNYFDYNATKVLDTYPKVLDEENQYNFEQAVCMSQALDDDIRIQIIIGRAGTGKTHIAMAAALEKVFHERKYDSIKLIKPIVTKSRLGEDIGFLPGSVKRKLIPRMRPFIDKLKQFTNTTDTEEGWRRLLDSGVIEMLNLADVRGADLANAFVIFDEAQNANPFQMRTLGTRLGEHTKLIVLGDPTQIDSIYLDKYSNALINLYENSLKHPTDFIAHICLVQMVRSHTSKWFEDTMKTPQQ